MQPLVKKEVALVIEYGGRDDDEGTGEHEKRCNLNQINAEIDNLQHSLSSQMGPRVFRKEELKISQ